MSPEEFDNMWRARQRQRQLAGSRDQEDYDNPRDIWNMAEAAISPTTSKTVAPMGEGNAADIIRGIQTVWPDAVRQTRQFARDLEEVYGDKMLRMLRDLYYSVCKHVQLRYDPIGLQLIRKPANIVAQRTADCKSFSLFLSSVLTNYQIPHVFRFVAWQPGAEVQHVYIVVCPGMPFQTVLDCNLKDFNKEKFPHYNEINIDMTKIYGIGQVAGQSAVGKSTLWKKLKKVNKSVTKVSNNNSSKGSLLARMKAMKKVNKAAVTAKKNGGTTVVDKLAARKKVVANAVKKGGTLSDAIRQSESLTKILRALDANRVGIIIERDQYSGISGEQRNNYNAAINYLTDMEGAVSKIAGEGGVWIDNAEDIIGAIDHDWTTGRYHQLPAEEVRRLRGEEWDAGVRYGSAYSTALGSAIGSWFSKAKKKLKKTIKKATKAVAKVTKTAAKAVAKTTTKTLKATGNLVKNSTKTVLNATKLATAAPVAALTKKGRKWISKTAKQTASSAKDTVKDIKDLATAPIQAVASEILKNYFPDAGYYFLYSLFIPEKDISKYPSKIQKKWKKQKKLQDKLQKFFGFKTSELRQMATNGLKKRKGITPEQRIAQIAAKYHVSGIGVVPWGTIITLCIKAINAIISLFNKKGGSGATASKDDIPDDSDGEEETSKPGVLEKIDKGIDIASDYANQMKNNATKTAEQTKKAVNKLLSNAKTSYQQFQQATQPAATLLTTLSAKSGKASASNNDLLNAVRDATAGNTTTTASSATTTEKKKSSALPLVLLVAAAGGLVLLSKKKK